MRKHLFFLVSVVAMLLVPMFSMAQTVYFTDGFENGLDAGWTQEFYDASQGQWVTETQGVSQPWKTETGTDLQYPKGAAVGNGRAYFRQEAAAGKNVQTTGYRTRLITPKMNLSGYQPILRFYHAQAKWTADFDTLRVYYRQGTNTQWELLREYTSPIQKWTFEEMDLPRTGDDYQIAFEANENMGRGIVLDSVIIRTKPQITTPHDMAFYDMRDNGVNLTWEASKDADAFRVVVSEMNLDLNVYPQNMDSVQYIVMDTLIASDLAQDVRVEKLASGRVYYMQVQSIGEFETSVWSEVFSFRVKPMVNITATQGYFEDFNLTYKSNLVKDMQLETWTWSGVDPIIPMWVGEENFYMYSPDASPAVVYTGKNTSSSGELTYSVPAGEVQYIVSPEISGKDIPNFKMSMCHVTFWGTTYKYQHNLARSIIVGVATDPNDPTTFVPVDTCTVWGYKQFTWFDVDLASYTGDGRYVAFVSNFQDNDNWFALDKVTIELKPALGAVKASDIKVIPTTTEAQLSWPAVDGAVSYKVKYQALETKGRQVPLTEDKMVGAVTVAAESNALNLTGLTARTKYVYCVQAVGADTIGAWSQPREFYTSAEMEIPTKYEFEESEGRYTRDGAGEAANLYYPRDWCVFTNDADAPYLYTSYYRNGSRCLYLMKDQYNEAWTVAPMVEDVKQVEVVFYARLSSTSYAGSNVIVGVMEDPSDLNTFTPVATCAPASDTYERFYTNFTNYEGTGKYIALVWGESGTTKNAICVDDLTFRSLASCFAPTMDIQTTDSSAVIAWTRTDDTNRYYIKVSAKALTEVEIPTATGEDLLFEYENYDGDTLVLNGLKYATQYFVYVQTICSETDKSDWTGTSFKTDCPEMMSLPYKNDFENENYSGSNSIPACWLKPTWSTTSSVYPYLSTSYNYDPSGGGKAGNCLYMYSSTNYGSTIALPKLDGNLENVKLRFKIYYSSAGYKVFAGVMGDPNNPDDFYPVDTFETVASAWVQCEAMFTAEDLKHGQYLAISSFTGASNYAYLDDVEVVDVINEAPFNYKKIDAGTDWFEVSWDGKTTDKWAVAVTSKRYAITEDFGPEAIAAADLIKSDTVATNGYKVANGLESLTWYYIYAKSTAGTEWSMDSIQTECKVWNPRVKMVQGFESDAAGNAIRSTTTTMSTTVANVNYFKNAKVPECWTVGNVKDGIGHANLTSSGYIPYICTDGVGSGADPSKLNYAEKAATTYQYSTDGVNSLKVYSYRTTSVSTNRAPAWAAMNKLECSDEDLKSLILTFDYQMGTTSTYAIVVGIMDDPTDLSTFTVLDSIPGAKGTGTGSHKHASVEIPLEDYQGTGRYIAFRGPYTATTTFYLDNVSVSLATCPNPKPSISQVTDNSAVIASGLRVDNGWKYIVTDSMYLSSVLDAGTMPDAAHIVAQEVVEDEGDGAPKMRRINGLSANTTYYAYAVTMCENNETSAWKMVEFTTLCVPQDAATWVGNFENDTTVSGYKPECWTVGSLTAGAAATYIPYVLTTTRAEIMADSAAAKTYNKTTGAVTGAKVLRLYAYGTATSVTSAGAYAITPGMKVAEGKTIQDYQIMFKGYGTSAQSGYTTTASYKHNLRVGMTTDPSDLSKMVILDTVAIPTNTQQCFVELSKYTGEGNYIVFLLEKEDVNNSQAFIYDIHLDLIPTCKVPGGIKLDTIGDTFIKASWNGNASQYNVAVSKKLYTDEQKKTYFANDSVIAADGIIFKTATEGAITCDGLEPNTVYYLYVQGKCSDTEMSLWSYESPMFHTECIAEMPVPVKENFEKYATGEVTPDCWKSVDIGGTGYPKIANVTSGAQSGNQFELWSTGTTHRTVVMLPKVVGNLSDYTFSMDARSYGTTTASVVYVGTMSDINDTTTFVPMDTFYMDGGNEFTHIEMELSKYNVVHDHIAITSGLGATLEKASDIYIDNIRLGYPISCFAPKNMKVENIGLTSAELSFEPADTISSKWEIELTKVGGAKQIFSTTKPSYTFSNLDEASAYSVIVRTDCDGDYSDYTDAITFNTKWKIDTYKWTFNQNEQGTVSVPNKAGAAVATYTLHPALVSTACQATLNYSSNTTYLPYQIANTTSSAYAEDKRDFVAGGDTARALRLYRYFSTSYAYGDSAAVILPYVLNPQGKQMSMDLRFGYAYASNHSTAKLQNVVSSTYPKSFLCIGTVDSLQTDLMTYKEITRVYAHPMVATDTLRAASNYGWMHYVLPLDMNLAGKQLVVMIQAPATAYICIDNLAIEAAENFTTPVITSVGAGDTYATLNWTGTAENYNIYVVDTAQLDSSKYIPYIQDAPAACVRKIENVTGNSYKVTGLAAGGNTYAFYVEDAAKAASAGALSNRAFATTVCEAIVVNGSYSYDFEPGPNYKMGANPSKSTPDGFTFQWPASTTASDTVYKTPDCWNYGITYASYDKTSSTYKSYNPTLRSNSMTAAATSQYRYARNGYSCMQFYGTSTYKEVYAVMPLMTGFDPDTMEINFWGRCTYEKVKDGTIYTTSYLKGTSYSTKMAVGTMTNPEDPTTFVALDTIEYDYTANDMSTSTVATSDPTGNSYWLNFTVPMKGAQGQYIAFKQVGYGYFYMDDLTIQKRQTARRPWNLEVVELGSTTAKVAWKSEEMAEGGKYIIQVSASATNWESSTIYETTKDTFEITGLDVAKQYFFRVQQVGSIYGTTDFAHYEAFTTECLPTNPNGYKTGFECDDDTDPWTVVPGATGTNANTLKQNQCWTYWNMGTNQTVSSSYFPYNIANTTSNGYSHSGGYALKISQNTTTAGATTYRMCVVSPYIDAELGEEGKGFDTLQVSFWACPTYHGLSGTNKGKISSASSTSYAKYIEIGTCTDPADSTTYTVLQGWTYEVEGDNLKTGVQADETNDFAFRKVTVKLNEATGNYVFIRPNVNRGDGKTGFTYSTMYIDDLQFEKLLNCPVPENLEAVEVSTQSAKVQWTGDAMSYDLQISADPTFTDDAKTLVDATDLTATSYTVEGLEPAKQYYFRVKAYCDAAKKDASDWTMTANFKTPYVPLYTEDFTMSLGEWRMAYGYANKVFAGKAAPRDTTSSGTYNSWYRVQNLALSGYAVRALLGYAASANPTYPISSTYQAETYYQKYWLISPSITIEKENAQLAFEAALTHYTTADPIYVHNHWNDGWDNQFMVIISEDDGQTWKQENAVIWNNETTDDPSDEHYKYGIGNYKLTDIPATPTQLTIDLTKYTGKTIRIAFYAENTDQNSLYGIHVDKIHVNYLTKLEENMTLCQFEDVDDVLGFSINGDTVPAGEIHLERSVLSYEKGKNDSLYVLDVNYKEAPQYYYEIEICAGTPFEYMGFNQHTAPGTYRMKLISQVTGCDSIVNFTIKHAEALRSVIDTTICQGDVFYFNGKPYSEAGTYSDTLQACALYGGCDSIVTLNLGIRATDRIVQPVTILHGESYQWYDYIFTESTIKDTVFTNMAGCDSTIVLNLTVKYADVDYDSVAICQGETYTWREKVYSEMGTYYDTVRVEGLADQIFGLMLQVNAPTYYEYAAAICAGDEYPFNGQLLTESGTYIDTLDNMYGCDSIVTLRLTVNQPQNETLDVAICHGTTYLFGGEELSKPGTYVDTIIDNHGCEAFITLNLTINDPLTGTLNAEYCGEAYYYQGVPYAEGTYEVWIKNEQGCDSIVTLTLTQTYDVHDTLNVTLCAGETYSDEHFTANKPGTYYNEVAEAGGCTTFYVLYFANYESEIEVVDSVLTTELPFTYMDLYYSEGTAPGIYKDTIETTSVAGCDLTIYHVLYVLENQDIQNILVENGQNVMKVLYRDHIYIIRPDGWYNVSGQKVNTPVK